MKFVERRLYLGGVLAFFCGSWSALQTQAATDSAVLYEYQGKSYKQAEMSAAMRQALYDAEKQRFEQISRIVDAAVLEQYLDSLAKKTGKTRQQVEDDTFKTAVSEADAKRWYEENKARLGGRDFDSIKNEVVLFLKRQEQEKIRDTVAAQVKKDGKFALTLAEPTPPVFEIATAGHPRQGVSKAKLTIVEFADYTCPHCRTATSTLKKVVEQYKDKVELVFLDFPLQERGLGMTIAEGAVCADAQAKFWDYHYMAFEQQASLSPTSPGDFAKKLGLDMKKFEACLQAATTKEKVLKGREEGERLGVQGTPAIYLNGRRHAGYSEETLTSEIKKHL